MSGSSGSQLEELIDLAQSPEDLQAAFELVDEAQAAAEQKNENASRFVVGTLAEVADFFGLASQTVREWRGGSNAMPGAEGKWDLREITQWKIAKLNKHSGPEDEASERELKRQREAIRIEDARLDLAKKKGELIDRNEALADLSEACGEIATRLQALPAEMAASEAADVRDVKLAEWKEKINLTLKSLERIGHGG